MSSPQAPDAPESRPAPSAPPSPRGPGNQAHPELSVVMPVHNEEAVIADVVASWAAELDALGMEYELRLYDDGSTDGTGAMLRDLAAHVPQLVVTTQPNRGHGPTILRGYREARGEWVFQTDGDGELGPGDFKDLWARRRDHDFLVGCRRGRRPAVARRIVTWVSRVAVRLLFGRGIRDVNSPYRLLRRQWLQQALPRLRGEPFAPNVILSGFAVAQRLRIHERPVRYLGRRAGRTSLVHWRLWRAAFHAFAETVRAARDASRERSM